MSAAKTAKPHRNLASRVGSPFPSARIRRWADRLGLNKAPQTVIDKCNEELLALNKLNGPVKPVPPARLGVPAEATPAEEVAQAKANHEAATAAFKAAWATWKDYTSPEYANATRIYTFYKNMKRLTELVRRETQTETSREETASLLDVLRDKPSHQGRREKLDDYNKRVEKFVAPGYAALLSGFANLEDANAIDLGLNELRAANPNIENFLQKDEASHEKTRFNDTGLIAITTGCEFIVAECARFAMRNALNDSKKIIQPDHVLTGIQESQLYPLFATLPHFDALVDRARRRVAHDLSNREKRKVLFQEARKRAQNEGRQYRKEDSPDTSSLKSFEEDEVAAGNAIKVQVEPSPKSKATEPRFTYLWHGVEHDDGERDSTNFDYYVNALCKTIKENEFKDNADGADGIKVSKNIKQFLSKLIIDFLARLAPLFRVLIEYNHVKTVEGNTVLAAYKTMFCDQYTSRDGNITWVAEHQRLFDEIQNRIDTWKTMSASAKAAAQADADADASDATDLSDAIADPLSPDAEEVEPTSTAQTVVATTETAPSAEPVAAATADRSRRGQVARKR
jgi:hypothetical protein